MQKVAVLISTYNGEKYLQEQIESILAQQEVKLTIYVRDDGSTDNTTNILKSYKSSGKIVCFYENNIGYAASFMKLIRLNDDADYYAFCDQDDVWDEDKLAIAINHLKGFTMDQPCLYLSQVRIVEENLMEIKTEYHERNVALGAAIEHNFAIGCTMVFNKKLRDLLDIDISSMELSMGHDSWVLCVALALTDNIYFDETAHMAYRQHGNNVSGKVVTVKQKIKAMEKILFKWSTVRSSIAQKILECYYDEVSIDNKEILKLGANYRRSIKEKIKLLKSTAYVSNYPEIDLLSKFAILVNKF